MPNSPFQIYNASAGSGKTYTLAKEYLKIILSNSRGYKQILAITFTNKAVNEMKTRILENLYEFSLETSIENKSSMFAELAEDLNLTSAQLQQKSKITLKEILHNYAFFDISTIDKFTHRLIRTFAKDLNLPQNFEVVLDVDLLLNEAISRLINKAGKDEHLTNVLIDFALEKIDDDKSWDIALDLNKVGKILFNETNVTHIKKLRNKEIDDFLTLQKTLKTQIALIEKQFVEDAKTGLELIHNNGLEFNNFTSSYFPKFLLKIEQGDFKFDFQAGWKQNFEEAPLYAKKCDETIKAVLDNLHPEFIQIFNELKLNLSSYQLFVNAYKNIVPLTVLNALQQEIKTIEMERDQLSISEFNSIISKEIKNQPAPFIYERLGEKYRHYFIDEFQDTSEMQWKNLIPLVSNALESEDTFGKKGSLFLVGDAKQAIYRWRGGKAEQFLDMVYEKSNHFVLPATVKNLPSNYRSYDEVIHFNNDFYTITSVFLNNTAYQTLFEEGNKQKTNTKQGGIVQLTFLEGENNINDSYCSEVMKTITQVREKKYTYQDICILVRSNKEGVLLANYLTQEQIPILSSESLLLKSSPNIKFLVNLLTYYEQSMDPEVAYELLSFLTPSVENQHSFIAEHINNVSPLLNSKYHFNETYLKQLSTYDLLEYAIKQFDLAPGSDAYLNHFMDYVLDVEQKEGTSIQTFLELWEKKKDKLSVTAPASIEAVQIMTIHKSKGLEFPIVIYPFANSSIYQEIEPKLWLPVDKANFNGFNEILIGKKQEVATYNETANSLYSDEQYKLELDAFNILYVATTRAVKGLYIITKKDVSKNGAHKTDYYSGLFIHYLKHKQLWNEHKNTYTFGQLDFGKKNDSSSIQANIPYQYSYKERPSFKIVTKTGQLWGTEREEALSKGNLIHEILAYIKTKEDVASAFNTVLKNGDTNTHEINLLKEKINQILEHPKLKNFYKAGTTIKNEVDIITQHGQLLRPDRVEIQNKTASIIDYKTGKTNPKYTEQLYTYADALSAMGYTVDNKVIIYINENVFVDFI